MAKRRDRTTAVLVDDQPFEVQTWWDPLSRNWITYILDIGGNQIGDAVYVYSGPDKVHKDIVADAEARIRLVLEEDEINEERYGFAVCDSRDSNTGRF